MSENTKIEWADDTVSFWWGCTRYGVGCLKCYAEKLSKRSGDFWGPQAPRLWIKSAAAECYRLDRKAEREGKPRIVFINSMSDFFEDHGGPVVSRAGNRMYTFEGRLTEGSSPNAQIGLPQATLDDLRREAFQVFDECQWLRFLLLTKRPENIRRMWPARTNGNYPKWFPVASKADVPGPAYYRHNVWIGTSIATQDDADSNVHKLLECRTMTPVLFLSAEPLIGPISLTEIQVDRIAEIDCLNGKCGVHRPLLGEIASVDWVIAGGESGHGARPMHPDWARSLRDQCQAAGVPFLFKQWGQWAPDENDGTHWFESREDGEFFEIGRDEFAMNDGVSMRCVGKKAAGRLLDGKEWNEFPEVKHG